LDLNKIKSTGRGGRIMKEDVVHYIESGQAAID
jgi:pyruvate/2-oxoglutarate dehydrogenase complex dihydrolipoamide acyltransferase (E2) component